jgi:hypothetical protein
MAARSGHFLIRKPTVNNQQNPNERDKIKLSHVDFLLSGLSIIVFYLLLNVFIIKTSNFQVFSAMAPT